MRRRRNRSTWFPVLGAGIVQGQDITVDSRFFTVDRPDTPNVIALPLIPDQTSMPDTTSSDLFTLRDMVEGQTCIIDRVVGKVVWSMEQFVPAGEPPADTTTNLAVCCTALCVLPVDENGSPSVSSEEFDPLLVNNSQQPWLWRRTWVLANNAAFGGSSIGDAFFSAPACNEFFASRDDGPHLDTKGTKRAIRREERLFIVHSARALDTLGDDGENGQLIAIYDVRVIGHLVKATNKSTFG